MISGTVVELCAVVSELAAERDVYRRKADRIGEQMAEVEELRAKVASHESMLDYQTNELNQSIERTATALAEVTKLRAELDALKAGKRAAPTCERCGTQLDTWCEQCNVPNDSATKDSSPLAVDLGHHKARAERLREALKHAMESCWLDEWAPMSAVKDASSVGTSIGYDLDEDDRLEREWASLRSADRVSLTEDQARQLWCELSGFDTTTAWSDLDQVHRAGFALTVGAHLGLTPPEAAP